MLRRTGIITALVATTALVGGVATAQETWTAEPFPQRPGLLSSIATATAAGGEVWAFGSFGQAGGTSTTSQVYRRGAAGSWTEMPAPAGGQLVSGAVVGPSDAWTIGWDYKHTGGTLHHWDGAAWTEIPVQVPGAARTRPDDVHAVGGEVWLVGKAYTDGPDSRQRTFVQRWDGAAWQNVPVPESAHAATFSTIGGAPDDLWLAGVRDNAAVSMHWDGTAWAEVPVPAIQVPDGAYLSVNDVAANAPNDVWFSGGVQIYDRPEVRPVLMHWDGAAWSEAGATNSPGEPGEFVRAEGALWNVAAHGVLRYEGTHWQAVAGPAEGPLTAGAETGDGRLVVIGSTGEPSQENPFTAIHQG
ncbi:hypothetical protein QFW96_22595 [Saccharopolyspora sp. TS4A08]|uniref:Exo-alpha-sialidase n=1 Tax=Saccharopolyspora ipomoeae TaxID=3042027 RepID=A0ABT6PTV9_9PSEU|nr:hypothetical protein [Saccharopolyspora sp. TS4A08]MDI2031435.1 hypothetical protein [Saccharopolyspora sp. TS4A08]